MKWICLLLVALSLYAQQDPSIEVPSLSLPLPEQEAVPFQQLPPPPIPSYKSPTIAVSLSAVVPGLGHAYLGEGKMALALMGGSSLGAFAFMDNKPASIISLLQASQVAYSYGLYASYRDARRFNGSSLYSYKMPQDSFSELVLAPLSWSVMKKKEVWGGILGSLGLAFAVSYFVYGDEPMHMKLSIEDSLEPMRAFPVAISEECVFRGLLQSTISESWNPTAGLVLSSLAFGAAHIPNAELFDDRKDRIRYYSFSLPVITLAGTYMGWLTYKNRSLKESVAMHMWYDFVLFSIDAFAASRASVRKPVSFSTGFSF